MKWLKPEWQQSWRIEKLSNIIKELISIHETVEKLNIDRLQKNFLEGNVSGALWDATKCLSDEFGQGKQIWTTEDNVLILNKGRQGLDELLERYQRDSWDIEDITGK
jgi:hypothetical protein